MQGELAAKFAYPICRMDTGFLYVFKEQSHPGRLILAHDRHISEMIELTDEERNAFFADVAKAARAIHKVFKPIMGHMEIQAVICICIWCPSMRAARSGAVYLR
jgi:diadenosine tetraphosphate (Ap4A) HIT family hydrolase